ncbi:MAG: Rpn family recombination-promoting nuclease/putative transposase [Bacteroidales bacterium]|nr:Rpn family recombination-promoting nuclease/putative transposase [Bacteroidales bacterium]
MKQSSSPYAPRIGRYASVLTDRQFKRIFGTEKNKRLTELLLGELIPERRIASLSFVSQEHVNSRENARDIRVDIECTDEQGARFVVEMQLASQEWFRERALYYSTFAVQQQVERGADGYDFPPVYFIGILDFSLHEGSDQVLFRYELLSRSTIKQAKSKLIQDELMTDRLNFIFLELPNCANALKPGASELENLCYTMHNMARQDEFPQAFFRNSFIELLLKSSETITFAPDEKANYLNEMTTKQDIENQIKYARKRGLAEGREAGLAEGREEGHQAGLEEGRAAGIAEGEAKGIAEGEAKAKLDAARKFKALGVSIQTICQATGLSAEEVESL